MFCVCDKLGGHFQDLSAPYVDHFCVAAGDVFDHPTARQLASLLQPEQTTCVTAATSLADALVSAGVGVGIDGLSALLPSGASSPWMAACMVGCGYDAIAQVPATRWDVHTQQVLAEPIASGESDVITA